MTASITWHGRLARGTAVAAAAVATAVLPLGAGAAHATTAPVPGAALPPGVVQLNDGDPCPPATLCLYRDYGHRGPAYGIGAGYQVDLSMLPMSGGVHGSTAANEVSSWVNNTGSDAMLFTLGSRQVRPLFPGQSLQETPATNDTVDFIAWA